MHFLPLMIYTPRFRPFLSLAPVRTLTPLIFVISYDEGVSSTELTEVALVEASLEKPDSFTSPSLEVYMTVTLYTWSFQTQYVCVCGSLPYPTRIVDAGSTVVEFSIHRTIFCQCCFQCRKREIIVTLSATFPRGKVVGIT